MSAWWDSREPRERLLLMILGGLVAIFLLIFAVILPVQGASASAQNALERAEADMRIVNRTLPSLSAGQQARAPFNRAALIRVARERNIQIARVQPGQDGALSIWIDEVQTGPLYGLFDDIMTDYAATMERASISVDNNGQLSAQFTLRPG